MVVCLKCEKIIEEKISKAFNLFLSKVIKPTIVINDICQLDGEMLDYLESIGVQGLILDVDETLRYDMQDLSPEVISWLSMIKKRFRVAVVSNGMDGKVSKILESMNIPYYTMAFKPCRIKVRKAIVGLCVSNRTIMMVGDDYIDDIYTGNRMNMKTCLVKKK